MAGPLQLVKLEQVLLYPHGANGDFLDITSRVIEINFFDDLFYPNLYGHLTVSDHMALRQHLPIQGGEKVDISWSVPWMQNSNLTLQFRVANLTDHQVHEGKIESYNLPLITEARYQSDLSRHSKLYSGTIQDVCNRIWKDASIATPLRFSSAISGSIQLLPTWWSAFDSLGYVTRLHSPEQKRSAIKDLIFHDYGPDAIIMRLSDLYRNGAIREYVYSEMPDPAEPFQIIQWQQHNHNGHWITGHLKDGVLNRETWHYDILNKTIAKDSTQYHNWFVSQPHLNPYPHSKGLNQDHPALKPTKFDVTLANGNASQRFGSNRDFLFHWLQAESVHVKICGDSKLRSGAIVNCLIPLVDYTSKTEERTSGKWLVTSIRHVIRRESYHCFLELSLPGLNTPLPVAKTLEI